jgi:hypothetical protein
LDVIGITALAMRQFGAPRQSAWVASGWFDSLRGF